MQQISSNKRALDDAPEQFDYMPEYSEEIANNFKIQERRERRKFYIERLGINSKQVNEMKKCREITVEFIWSVQRQLNQVYEIYRKTSPQAKEDRAIVLLAIKIMDKFLYKEPEFVINKKNWRLLAAVCHYIANKFIEHQDGHRDVFTYLRICFDMYTRRQFRQMERRILVTTDFRIAMITAFDFLNRGYWSLNPHDIIGEVSWLILEAVQYMYEFIDQLDSKIAAVSHYIANRYFKIPWSEEYVQSYGYEETELMQLAFRINRELEEMKPRNILLHRIERIRGKHAGFKGFRSWNKKVNNRDIAVQKPRKND